MIFGFDPYVNVVVTTILETWHQCEIIDMLTVVVVVKRAGKKKRITQEEKEEEV